MLQNTLFRNLHFPESNFIFTHNIIMEGYNIIHLPNPNDYSNSCNEIVLKTHDECDETRGKITFIPIGYFKEIFPDIVLNDSLIEQKKFYLEELKKRYTVNYNFLQRETYKNIPLVFFRKHFLFSELSKTVDQSRIYEETEEENMLNMSVTKNKFNPVNDMVKNSKEWLKVGDVMNLIKSNIYSLTDEKRSYIQLKPALYIPIERWTNKFFYYSKLKNRYDFKINNRFTIFFILHLQHFNAVLIDNEVYDSNNHKTKCAYFFDSVGYNPKDFNYNKNYWFFDNSLNLLSHKKIVSEDNIGTNSNMPIETITEILLLEEGVTNFVFNTFCIQNLNSECGTFSSMFLILCINMIKEKNLENIKMGTLRCLYYNLMSLGYDHIYSCLRGLLFFNISDSKFNNITYENYLDSPEIFEMKNEKYMAYKKMYNFAFEKICDIINKFEKKV